MEVNKIQIINNNNKLTLWRQSAKLDTPVQFSHNKQEILAPLKQDTVSFKGSVLKKSDFKGSDLAVIEKYKPNIQQFKSKEDLQKFAENKINELKEKDFDGRQEETTIQRKAMLKEWFYYVTEENDAYSNTQKLIILSAITKNLKPNNDTIPPVLHKGVLAQTVTELEEKLKANPKENFDFNKMYQNNLRTSFMKDSSTGETMTGWVVIPSKKNDPGNFEKNVEKLKALSHNSWCTKSFNAEPYLSEGDFHVYLENGEPKLGVRFVGDEVQEIQGERNNGKIPVKYLDTFKSHQKDCELKLTECSQDEVINAEKIKTRIEDFHKKYGESFKITNIKDAETVLKILGINFINKSKQIPSKIIFMDRDVLEENDKQLLSIDSYNSKLFEITCDDLNVNENDLFKFIDEIHGAAIFEKSNVTNLGNLKRINGYADFDGSQIKDLGQLEFIGGNASFENSFIENLGKLEYIGGTANFQNSQVENLGNLLEINGDAKFQDSLITNLCNLEIIRRVDFSGSEVKDLGKLEKILGNAIFSNSMITNLANLKYIGGDADFSYSDISDLGQLEHIGESAFFANSQVEDLSNLKYVGGDLFLKDSKVNKLCRPENVIGKINHNDMTMDWLMQFEDEEILAYADDLESEIKTNTRDYNEDSDLDDNEKIWQMLEQG